MDKNLKRVKAQAAVKRNGTKTQGPEEFAEDAREEENPEDYKPDPLGLDNPAQTSWPGIS